MRTLKSELIKWQKTNNKQTNPNSDRKKNDDFKKNYTEILTEYEWKDMMGQFNQTLRRHRGALRR